MRAATPAVPARAEILPKSVDGVVVVGKHQTNWPITPVTIPKPFTLPELAKAVHRAAEGA